MKKFSNLKKVPKALKDIPKSWEKFPETKKSSQKPRKIPKTKESSKNTKKFLLPADVLFLIFQLRWKTSLWKSEKRLKPKLRKWSQKKLLRREQYLLRGGEECFEGSEGFGRKTLGCKTSGRQRDLSKLYQPIICRPY